MKRKSLISYFILALGNCVVYFFSLFHVARSDQMIYLANTSMTRDCDWYSLAITHFSYDRVQNLFGGYDALLFRPLFFFVLGMEKYFFGYNFMLWQVTGFLLHLFVVWNVLRLLRAINDNIFAVLLTAYFSVLLIGMEMVVWHHVSSYLIFISCILICLYHLHRVTTASCIDLRSLVVIFLALLVACFLYEVAFIYGILFFVYFGIVVLCRGKTLQRPSRRWGLLILLPGILYLACNWFDFHLRGSTFSQGKSILEAFHIWPMIENTFISMYWWLYSGIFPNLLNINFYQRTTFIPENIFNFTSFIAAIEWQVGLGIAAVCVYVSMVFRGVSWRFIKSRWLFGSLVTIMLFIQMVITVFGRTTNRELMGVLVNNAYYGYFFWVLLIVILHNAINFTQTGKGTRVLKILAATCLIILIVENGYFVWHANKQRAKLDATRHFLVGDIEHLRKQPQNAQDFSFLVHPTLEYRLPWVKKYRGDHSKQYTYLELLYPQYHNLVDPKYAYRRSSDGIKRAERK